MELYSIFVKIILNLHHDKATTYQADKIYGGQNARYFDYRS